MQHNLINMNQVRFHGLDLLYNQVCDDELCIKLDNETEIPLQFKGTKSAFGSIVPTRSDLESCPHYDMTNDAE